MSQAKFLWSPKSAWGCQSKTTHPQTHIKSDKTFPLKSSSNRSRVIFSSVSGRLGHFYVLTVVQSVARNTGMQRTFLIMVFSRSMPSSASSSQTFSLPHTASFPMQTPCSLAPISAPHNQAGRLRTTAYVSGT